MKIRGEYLTVKRIARFIKNFLFERNKMLIFKMDISDTPKKVEYEHDVEISKINNSDLDALMRDKRSTHKATMLKRLKQGDLCFKAQKNGKIYGYIWIRKNTLYFSEVYYKVRTDELSVWVYDELVFDEFRGKGIQQKILLEIFKQCKNLGYKRVYVGILSDNEPSLKAHMRFGFEKLVKEIRMQKILGIKRHNVIVHWKVDDE